jgi:hypothetical protein
MTTAPCSPIRWRIDPKIVAQKVHTGDVPPSGTTRFAVLGFDPRLRVLVTLFFQPKPGASNWSAYSTSVPRLTDWKATPFVVDGTGERRKLQALPWADDGVASVITGDLFHRPLPPNGDGFEFDTEAQGIEFECRFALDSLASPDEDGAWWALVEASSVNPGMSHAEFHALTAKLILDVGPPLRLDFS